MHAATLLLTLGLLGFAGCEAPSDVDNKPDMETAEASKSVPVRPASATKLSHLRFAERPGEILPRIEDGTDVTDGPPEGWSHRVLLVQARVAQGDLKMVTPTVAKYASMFRSAILANVKHDSEDDVYWLDKVAVGMAIEQGGKSIVMATGGRTGNAAKLDLIARNVLQANEKCLDDMIVVARTPRMIVFDAGALMLADGDHQRRLMRHAILVDPATGELQTLVWALNPTADDAERRLVTSQLQRLPRNYVEDRILNVLARKFILGIPKAEAFAVVRIPPGEPVDVPKSMLGLVGSLSFKPEEFLDLEAELSRLVAE